MNEKEIREQIARDIEEWEILQDTTNINPEVWKFIKEHFASIARGNK